MKEESKILNLLKNKKVFIFDLDGTLIDSVGIWNEIDKKIIEELASVNVSLEVINHERDKVVGESTSHNPYVDYIKFLKEKYKLKGTIEGILEYRRNLTNMYLKEKINLKPYAKELLELLYKEGIILTLATTTNKRCLNIYKYDNPNTSELDFDSLFKLQLTMEDVINFKPNPEIHLKTIELLNANPEEVVVFEDTIPGVLAALNAGISVVAISESHSQDKRYELERMADCYVNSLQDIYENYLKLGKKLRKINKN